MLLLMTNINLCGDASEKLSVDFFANAIPNKIVKPGPALIEAIRMDIVDPTWDVIFIDARKSSKDTALALLNKIQDLNSALPIFVLLSESDPISRSDFLTEGAWDCFSMPFSMSELVIRLKGIARRSGAFKRHLNKDKVEYVQFGNLKFLPTSNRFFVNDNYFLTTLSDASILKVLIQNPEQVVARERLSIQKASLEISSGALDSQISRLRKRLVVAGANINIKPAYGAGYRLCQINCEFDETLEKLIKQDSK